VADDNLNVSGGGAAPPKAVEVLDEDVRKLHELGYAQVLDRRMSGFQNMAICSSV
jgi:hypothetical protein